MWCEDFLTAGVDASGVDESTEVPPDVCDALSLLTVFDHSKRSLHVFCWCPCRLSVSVRCLIARYDVFDSVQSTQIDRK